CAAAGRRSCPGGCRRWLALRVRSVASTALGWIGPRGGEKELMPSLPRSSVRPGAAGGLRHWWLSSRAWLLRAVLRRDDAGLGEPEIEEQRGANDYDANDFGSDHAVILEHRTRP